LLVVLIPVASAFIVGDPRGHIWQLPGESFQAFEERVKAAAQDFSPSER
jgi:hypothetical protein